MQQVGKDLRFSASDLVGHLDCHHLTALDAAVARSSLGKPKIWDPILQTLVERGLVHERQYVEHLKQMGINVVEIQGGGVNSTQAQQTLEAMRSGADVIVQGALLQGVWSGRADILRMILMPPIENQDHGDDKANAKMMRTHGVLLISMRDHVFMRRH